MPWAPDYVTADDVADFVRVDDAIDDVDYGRCATTASRAVDLACKRQFGRTESEARFYTPEWSYTKAMWVIPVDDVVVLTGVAVCRYGDDVWTDLDLPRVVRMDANAPAEGRPWERLGVRHADMPTFLYPHDSIRVTAEFGWASVPVAIEEATLLQASRLAARRDSPMGVAGSPDTGSELRLLARLDPDVLTSVKPYRRRYLP